MSIAQVLPEVVARLGDAAEAEQQEAEVVVGVGEGRVARADRAQLGDGQVGVAELVEQVGQVVARLGLIRLELEGALVGARAPPRLAAPIAQVAEVGQRGGERRLELERAPVGELGQAEVAGVLGAAAVEEALVGARQRAAARCAAARPPRRKPRRRPARRR